MELGTVVLLCSLADLLITLGAARFCGINHLEADE
jgi:hypothetical protein